MTNRWRYSSTEGANDERSREIDLDVSEKQSFIQMDISERNRGAVIAVERLSSMRFQLSRQNFVWLKFWRNLSLANRKNR